MFNGLDNAFIFEKLFIFGLKIVFFLKMTGFILILLYVAASYLSKVKGESGYHRKGLNGRFTNL